MRGVRRSNLQSQPPAQLLSRLLEVRAAEVCDPARGTLRRSEEWAATRGDAMRRRRWGQADHSAANSADPPAPDPPGPGGGVAHRALPGLLRRGRRRRGRSAARPAH